MRRLEHRWIRESKPELEDLARLLHIPLTGLKVTKCCKRTFHAHALPANDVFQEHCVITPWLLMLLGYVCSNKQMGSQRISKGMRMLETLVMPAVAKLDSKQKNQRKENQKNRKGQQKIKTNTIGQ